MELTASANNSKRGRIFRNIDLVCALCFSSWLCKRCFLYFMVRARSLGFFSRQSSREHSPAFRM